MEIGRSDSERRYGTHFGTLVKHLRRIQTHSFSNFGEQELPLKRFLDAVEEVPCQVGAIEVTREEFVSDKWTNKPATSSDGGQDGRDGSIDIVNDDKGNHHMVANVPKRWSSSRSKRMLQMDTRVRSAHAPLLRNVDKCVIDTYVHHGKTRAFVRVEYKDGSATRVEATKGRSPSSSSSDPAIDLVSLSTDEVDAGRTIEFEYDGLWWHLPNEKPFDADTVFRVTSQKSSGARVCGTKWRAVGARRPKNGVELTNDSLARALATKLDFTQAELLALGLSELAPHNFIKMGGQYFQPDTAVLDDDASRAPLNPDVCYMNRRSTRKGLKQCPLDMSFMPPVHPGISLAAMLFEGAIFDVQLHDDKIRTVQVRYDSCDASFDLELCYWRPRLVALAGMHPPPHSDMNSVRQIVMARTPTRESVTGRRWRVEAYVLKPAQIGIDVRVRDELLLSRGIWAALKATNGAVTHVSRCQCLVFDLGGDEYRCFEPVRGAAYLWRLKPSLTYIKDETMGAIFLKKMGLIEDASLSPLQDKIDLTTPECGSLRGNVTADTRFIVHRGDVCVSLRPDDAIDIEEVKRHRGPYVDALSDVFTQERTSCRTGVWKAPLKHRRDFMSRKLALSHKDVSRKVEFHTTSHVSIGDVVKEVTWEECAPVDLAGYLEHVSDVGITVSLASGKTRHLENPRLKRLPQKRALAGEDAGRLVIFSTTCEIVIDGGRARRLVRWPTDPPSTHLRGSVHHVIDDSTKTMIRKTIKIQSRLGGDLVEMDNPELTVNPNDEAVFTFSSKALRGTGVPLAAFLSKVTRVTSDAVCDDMRGVVSARVVNFCGTPHVVLDYSERTSEPPFYVRLRRDSFARLEEADIFCNICLHSAPDVTAFVRAHDAPLTVTTRRLPTLVLEDEKRLSVEGLPDSILGQGLGCACWPRKRGFDGNESASSNRGGDFNDAMQFGLRHEDDALLTLQTWLDTTRSSLLVVRNPNVTFTKKEVDKPAVSATPDGLVVSTPFHIVVGADGDFFLGTDDPAVPLAERFISEAGAAAKGGRAQPHVVAIESHWVVEECQECAHEDAVLGQTQRVLARALLDYWSTRDDADESGHGRFSIRTPQLNDPSLWTSCTIRVYIDEGGAARWFHCIPTPRFKGLPPPQLGPESVYKLEGDGGSGDTHWRLSFAYTIRGFVEAKSHIGGRNIFRLRPGEAYHEQIQSQSSVTGLQNGFFVSWSSKQTAIFSFQNLDRIRSLVPSAIHRSIVRQKARAPKKSMLGGHYRIDKTAHTLRCSSVEGTDDETYTLRKLEAPVGSSGDAPIAGSPVVRALLACDSGTCVRYDHGGDETLSASVKPDELFKTALSVTTYAPGLALEVDPLTQTELDVRRAVVRSLGVDADDLVITKSDGALLQTQELPSLHDKTHLQVTGSVRPARSNEDITLDIAAQNRSLNLLEAPPDRTIRVLCAIDVCLCDVMEPKIYVYAGAEEEAHAISHVLSCAPSGAGMSKVWRRHTSLVEACRAHDVAPALLVPHPTAPPPRLSVCSPDEEGWEPLHDGPSRMMHADGAYAIAEAPEIMLRQHLELLKQPKAQISWQTWWSDLFTILMLQVDNEQVVLSIDPALSSKECTNAAVDAAIMCGEMIEDASEPFVPVPRNPYGSCRWIVHMKRRYDDLELALLEHSKDLPDGVPFNCPARAHDGPRTRYLVDDERPYTFKQLDDHTWTKTSEEVDHVDDDRTRRLLREWKLNNKSSVFQSADDVQHSSTIEVHSDNRIYEFAPHTVMLLSDDYKMLRTMYSERRRPRFEDRRLEDKVLNVLTRLR